MIKYLISIIINKGKKGDKSSNFSKFFREASSREKKKVFLDVAKKASKEQRDVIQSTRFAR
jgi:hypothetical protein